MPSKCLSFLLSLLYLQLISSKTYQEDGNFIGKKVRTEFLTKVSDLDEVLDLVLNSSLTLRGWRNDTDPCGRVVPCGINDLDECQWEGIACVMDKEDRRIAGM